MKAVPPPADTPDRHGRAPAAVQPDRLDDVLAITPGGKRLLDAGTHDAHMARALASRFDYAIALDLYYPAGMPREITAVQGSILELPFDSEAFDVVLCTEVLEHIAVERLEGACRELRRVAKRAIVIGVPYRQDTRLGRTTCQSCGRANPAWGHVNTFDERRLAELFEPWLATRWSYVGRQRARTNTLSTLLMDYAGNPHGAYGEYHSCVYCGALLLTRGDRNLLQKIATRLAIWLNAGQQRLVRTSPIWVHVVFER